MSRRSPRSVRHSWFPRSKRESAWSRSSCASASANNAESVTTSTTAYASTSQARRLPDRCLCRTLKAKGSDSAESAARVVELIEEGITLSRNLARGLHSVGRSGDGLMEALEDFAASTNDLFKISCRFECPLPVLISDIQVAQHLYRIAQEAVGNAIKHGRARNIEIRLEAHKGGKRLSIIDDGAGRPPFPPDGRAWA